MRIEVSFADQRRVITGGMKDRRDVRSVVGRRDAVRDDSMSQRVLPREHRRAARHADDVLNVRAFVEQPCTRERIDDGRACHRVAGHSERIEALLIRGDEQDVPAAALLRSVRGRTGRGGRRRRRGGADELDGETRDAARLARKTPRDSRRTPAPTRRLATGSAFMRGFITPLWAPGIRCGWRIEAHEWPPLLDGRPADALYPHQIFDPLEATDPSSQRDDGFGPFGADPG
jgi:hypothetical protein